MMRGRYTEKRKQGHGSIRLSGQDCRLHLRAQWPPRFVDGQHVPPASRRRDGGAASSQRSGDRLSQIDTAFFEAVFAVFNLLDAVSHEDRLQILAEVRRILIPGGLLIFSSHNRNYIHAQERPRLHFQRNPMKQLRSLLGFLQGWLNSRRIRSKQRFEPEYALLNDSGHNFAVLHYYIDRAAQAKQLRAAGFELLKCQDELGRTLGPEDDDSAYSTIHYVARLVGF
jgi:SAM-dependent methyltransferase